ncbi:hypothetical protein DXG03_009139, partial [Asterophora parasitica]
MEEYWTFTVNKEDTLPAVVEQASKAIIECQSSLGKEVLSILSDIYYFHGLDKDSIIEWVEDTCSSFSEFCWLYAKPDAPQSDFVLNLFAWHLKQANGAIINHGLPVGGLAVCMAAMERAFELWSSGKDPKKKTSDRDNQDTCDDKKKFSGDKWVVCTAGYAKLALGLREDKQWPKIISGAEAHIPATSTSGTEFAAVHTISQPEAETYAALSL